MSITKQILFITNAKKANELQKALSVLTQKAVIQSECSVCEIYQCDESSSEFLLYMQWKTQEGYRQFESNYFNEFEQKCKNLIIKKEVLRLD